MSEEADRRFRVALANTSIVIFESDTKGYLSWIYNSQLGPIVGSLIGRRLHEFMTQEDADALDEIIGQVVTTGARMSTETVVNLKGTLRHLLLNFEALRDADGKSIGLTGTAIDITQAKQAQEQSQQALAFRDRMMGILGHDLRNPLSAVQGIANLLLLDAALPKSTREALGHIDKATRRMGEMIQMVMDFTRTRFQGSLPIARKSMSLADLCGTVVDEARAANPDREFLLESVGNATGEWDPARMAQVISNLVGNAISHGESGQPVRVSVQAAEQSVSVAVKNRAPGIAKEKLAKLFEPFEQGTIDTARPQGLGLGLYIARQIVTSHGGTLDADSADGDVTFTVHLPR